MRIFPFLFTTELEKAIGTNCKTILDVGCGSNSPIRFFSNKYYSVGIDAYIPSIEKSKEKGIHNKYLNITFSELGKIGSGAFDCVVALEVIEHLKKNEGLRFLDNIERIAKKKIIVFAPNGFLLQSKYDNNPWQIHRSGWEPKEMRKRGYKVVGISGLKTLRGERARIKWTPGLLWEIVSMITQVFVRNYAEFAFHILCIKNKE
jgi:SAM-dependent methyltransferase